MIVIRDIIVEEFSESGRVEVQVSLNDKLENLYYQTNFKLDKIIESDLWNAAIIALLPLSFENNWNIKSNGIIDETLKDGLINELFPVMKQAYTTDFTPLLDVESQHFSPCLMNNQTATGLSCGVDSFATIFSKQKELSALTFFDAGSHGKNFQQKTDSIRQHRFSNVELVASKLKMPLYTVTSNLSNFTKAKFQDNHAFLQLSCAHLLCGICNVYHYSTGQKNDYLDRHELDFIYINNFLTPALSSGRLKIKTSLGTLTRFQRTYIISEQKIPQQHLDVCVDPFKVIDQGLINCSGCDKCLRTQLALKIQGNYESFSSVFNEQIYNVKISRYIAFLKFTRKKNVLNGELYDLAVINGLIDVRVRMEFVKLNWNNFKKILKKKIRD
ncbi:hypothetical protein [uncultured Nonlabens sp.]|uniref:hypothetical protein n=1 Tax=uncultured Nonlabens sp. TaxID=859306 RepID=UPI00261F1C28|nr:hypothetical protein [uncultured Nonlabens sp.]